MNQEVRDALRAHRCYAIIEYAKTIGNVVRACRDFDVPRASFYRWKKVCEADEREGLLRKRPVARSHPRQIPPECVETILHLRTTCHLGPQRIAWYLERYHGFKISCSSGYRTLKRNGVGPLPRHVGRRAIHTRRYAKRVPGHQIQVDVKFLNQRTEGNRKSRRYQFTAIDDATRVRALKIYQRHNQKSAITSAEWQGREIAQDRPRGVLPAPDLYG